MNVNLNVNYNPDDCCHRGCSFLLSSLAYHDPKFGIRNKFSLSSVFCQGNLFSFGGLLRPTYSINCLESVFFFKSFCVCSYEFSCLVLLGKVRFFS